MFLIVFVAKRKCENKILTLNWKFATVTDTNRATVTLLKSNVINTSDGFIQTPLLAEKTQKGLSSKKRLKALKRVEDTCAAEEAERQ